MKKTFKIEGMHCNSCAQTIENSLRDNVNSISVSYSKEKAEIDFDPEKISEGEIKKIIKECGYSTNDKEEIKTKKSSSNWIGWIMFISSLVLLSFVLYKFLIKI